MEKFIDEVEEFLSASGMKETTFGIMAINDGKFVRKLRTGRRCWPETMDRVRMFIKEQRQEIDRFKTICTQDGTWIAVEKASGQAHSGRSARHALANLRKAIEVRA